ncbi:minichromosome maintenance- protein [Rhizophlyctis rosea]|uniref:Minichromosome maintenance- protein n=1 Tax=Rhizophlyctis rosea TaxID=64517 RepID=A0AAD5SIB1_9FUNG|nr:minichromosome maintenance- protein [Rhizophlyctis rosea]
MLAEDINFADSDTEDLDLLIDAVDEAERNDQVASSTNQEEPQATSVPNSDRQIAGTPVDATGDSAESDTLVESIEALERKLAELKRKKERFASGYSPQKLALDPLDPTKNGGTKKRKSTDSPHALSRGHTSKVRKVEAISRISTAAPSEANHESKSFMTRIATGSREYRELQAVLNVPKANGFAKRVDTSATKESAGSDDKMIETHSGLRLKSRTIPHTHFLTLMSSRRPIPLPSISTHMHGDDIPGDWVAIGVIASKSPPRTASTGKKYILFKLTDLAGCIVNVFAFGRAFEGVWKETVGSVVAILNPRIVLPNEALNSIALDVNDANKWMKIGDSLDFGLCKGVRRDGQPCPHVVNTRNGDRCDEHALAIHKSAKLHRQEFATGNAMVTIGDPQQKASQKGKRKVLQSTSLSSSATYTFPSGQAFCAEAMDVRDMKPCRSNKTPTKADKEKIAALTRMNNAASRQLRAVFGMEELEEEKASKATPRTNIFGANAIAKMGYDPMTGRDFVSPREKRKTAEMVELEFDSEDEG